MPDRRVDDVLRRLRRLVAGGHDDVAFRAGADAILGPRLRYDIAAWSTVDPATALLTSCDLVGIDYDPARERKLLGCEYEVEDPVGAHYADLARASVPAASLHLSSGGQPQRSPRHRLILEPAGIVDDLRAALVDGGVPWGTLTAYRMAGEAPFGADDVRLAAAAAPVLGLGLRRGLLQRACATPLAEEVVDDPPGMLVTDPGGTVVLTTGAAERWLDQIDAEGRLPSAFSALAASLRSEAPDQSLDTLLPARDGGWVAIHASHAKGLDGHISYVVERPRPAVLAAHIATVHGLTERERDVAALTLRGLSTKEVAAALGASAYTVNDHLKSVFAKVGVTSRGHLTSRLLDLEYLPRVQLRRPPAPYGWFLEREPPTPTGSSMVGRATVT